MGAFGDFFNSAKDYFRFREFVVAASRDELAHITDYLSKNPKDLNRQEFTSGKNVLMCATVGHAANTMKYLLDKGASIRGQDAEGYTVLHLAITCSPRKIVDILLQRSDIGSIINEKNRLTGVTALMYAAMVPDNPALVQSLLDKGANPHAKDFKGRTALSIAKEKGRTKVVALLEQLPGMEQSQPPSRPLPPPKPNLGQQTRPEPKQGPRRRQPPKPRQFDL